MTYGIRKCLFCEEDLKKYPEYMFIVKQYEDIHNGYIKYLKANNIILGNDDYYIVKCPNCGSKGSPGLDKSEAIDCWNRRNAKDWWLLKPIIELEQERK